LKYICKDCGTSTPCIIDAPDGLESPYACPYANEDDGIYANWKKLSDSDYFEMRGLCADFSNNDETCSFEREKKKTQNDCNAYREYEKHEFCLAMRCAWLKKGECQLQPGGCLFAKEFHIWLKKNGFKIVKNKDGIMRWFKMTETDPNGIDQHSPGAKLDNGKILAGILQQWPRALTAVLEVATFGAQKYTRGGWMHVENGVERYTDAMFRHLLAEPLEPVDPDSGLSHEAHAAWNALSRLELKLTDTERKNL